MPDTPYDLIGPIGPDDVAGQILTRYLRTEWEASQPTLFSNPAAGSDFLPFGLKHRIFKLELLTGQLVTSAAVATRAPQYVIKTQNGEVLARLVAPSTQAASLTQTYTWGLDVVSQSVVGGDVTQSIPDIWLPPGATISIVTASIDVADQWSLGAALYLMR